jgi:glucose-1-phosphate thymidylyltransferase
MSNNLAVVGFYYFREAEHLLAAIDEQMHRDLQLKGEYYLVDAINLMLEKGLRMRVHTVDVWLDAGTPEAILETNRYLLANGKDNCDDYSRREDVVIIPPAYIHPSAEICCSIVGPNVSLGAGCRISHCIIEDSILEDEAEVDGVILKESLIGRRARLIRRAGIINAGDNTEITL